MTHSFIFICVLMVKKSRFAKEVDHFRSQVLSYEHLMERASMQIEDYYSHLLVCQLELTSKQATNESYVKHIKDLECTIEALKKRESELKVEKNRTSEELGVWKYKTQLAEDKVSHLESNLTQIRQDCDTTHEKFVHEQNVARTASETCNQLEKKLRCITSQRECNQMKIEELDTWCIIYKQENMGSKEAIERLSAEVEDLKHQRKDLVSSQESYCTRIGKLEEALNQLTANTRFNTKQIAKQTNISFAAFSNSVQTLWDRLDKNLQEKQDQLLTCQEKCSRLKMALEKMRIDMAEMNSQVADGVERGKKYDAAFNESRSHTEDTMKTKFFEWMNRISALINQVTMRVGRRERLDSLHSLSRLESHDQNETEKSDVSVDKTKGSSREQTSVDLNLLEETMQRLLQELSALVHMGSTNSGQLQNGINEGNFDNSHSIDSHEQTLESIQERKDNDSSRNDPAPNRTWSEGNVSIDDLLQAIASKNLGMTTKMLVEQIRLLRRQNEYITDQAAKIHAELRISKVSSLSLFYSRCKIKGKKKTLFDNFLPSFF